MPQARFSKMRISALSVTMPDYPRRIEEDIDCFGGEVGRLERAKKIVGYGARYVCPEGVTATDLCRSAAVRLLTGCQVDPESLDAVICVTPKGDFLYPGSASVLHRDLGLPKSCLALDLNHACPGFVFGLWTAAGLMEGGAIRRALLVAGDFYSSYHRLQDSLLFGDAGSACLLESDGLAGESFFSLGSDGGRLEMIFKPGGGGRLPAREDLFEDFIGRDGKTINLLDEIMDGLTVLNFSLTEAPADVQGLLEFAGKTLADVDFAAIHQANKQMVERVAAKIGLAPEQFSADTFSQYGNMSGASIPGVIVHKLKDRLAEGRIRTLLSAFGVGAGWGSALLNLDKVRCFGIDLEKYWPRSRAEEIEFWKKRLGKD